jgi:4-hydroxythreonine-4-phosphate dehydrogenase
VLVHGTPLADWLPPGEALRWGCAEPLPAMFAAASAAGLEITCCDGETDDDLGHIARTVRAGGDALIAVGAAGLASALAGEGAHRPVALDGPVLFVIGSRTRETAEQVVDAAAIVGTMVVAVDGSGRPWPPVAPGTRAVVLVADAAMIAPGTEARTVAGWLARATREIIGRFPARTIVLSGGDTAHAVLDHMGCGLLTIVGEVEPGVPVAEADFDGGTVRIVTKAGGFGGPDLLARIAGSA